MPEVDQQRKQQRKAAKKLIKLAKCCPEYYNESDVAYAKLIKRQTKK